MLDSKYSVDIYKSVRTNIRTVVKNPEMLKQFINKITFSNKICS